MGKYLLQGVRLYELTLLIIGVITFLVGIVTFLYSIKKGRLLSFPIVLLILSVLMIGFPAISQFSFKVNKGGVEVQIDKHTFDQQTARVLGRAYFLANPLLDPNNLKEYIQQNKAFFMEAGDTIILAKALGSKLVYQGLASFSQEDYNKGYESALGMGATMEMARDVADSISSASVDADMMGRELLWLAEVLPYAANGDWGPFLTTGTMARNQIRLILPSLRMMSETDPEFVNTMMKQFETIAEDQIVMLAIMSGYVNDE